MEEIKTNDRRLTADIRVCTWNAGGIFYNVKYLDNCLKKSDICILTEHWLFPDSLSFLNSINEDFTPHARSSSELEVLNHILYIVAEKVELLYSGVKAYHSVSCH